MGDAGLPQLRVARAERLRCRCSKKASSALAPVVAKGMPLLAAASATAASAAPMLATAMALADERMSTEGTRLSNDLLGWILLVAVGLVLSFYTVYSSMSILDDDDDQSGAGGITL